MKKNVYLFSTFLFVCSAVYSQEPNFKATIKESDDAFEFYTKYDKSKHQDVVSYMDKVLGKSNNISFSNTQLDAKMTLDDKSKFYIKLSAGTLTMKVSKKENTEENYKKLKRMCEDLSKIAHQKK
ncbi:MAG TPA: hypothetical protein VHO90_13735 [Bacteroidales bacterium]|nr:hypothetical protein [Bacteroidales bacterium]